MTDRFTLEDYYDDGTAIIDTTKPPMSNGRIVIVLPVYSWALQPLVDLMNELDRQAKHE